MEQVIKKVCRLSAEAVVEPSGAGYKVTVKFACPCDGFPDVEIAPARTGRTQPLAEEMVFEGLNALELTELYRITVKGETESITRMMLIPTKMPKDRDDMVIRSVLKDKKSFVDYLAFILGDDHVLSVLEMGGATTSDRGADMRSKGVDLPAIYEKMLKTACSEPERLKEIGLVMARVANSDVVPDEFVKMYDTFVKTLKLK